MVNKSTSTAIFERTRGILKAIQKKEIQISLFLDLSKAFDLVNHSKFLEKLEAYGIRDKQLKLIQSNLEYIRFSVYFDTI